MDEIKSPTKTLPTDTEFKKAILMCQGYAVTFRSYKQCCSKKYRALLSKDFYIYINQLTEANVGKICSFRVDGASKESIIFVKNKMQEWEDVNLKNLFAISESAYEEKRNGKVHRSITTLMQDHLS